MILSLIVPIYNVEKYIIECLESIVSNILSSDVEVIIVNDGSPDKSIDLVRSFLLRMDENIRGNFIIVEQENQGLSAARNVGIKISRGAYIGFLDSDDLLSNNYFEKILSIIKKYDCDIIDFDIYRFSETKNSYKFLKNLRVDGIYELDMNLLMEVSNQCAWYAPKRVYKKNLFDDIKFPVGMNFEDVYTIPYIFIKAKNIFVLNECYILYRYNPEGISTQITEKNLLDLRNSIIKISNSIDEHPFLIGSLLSVSRIYMLNFLSLNGVFKAYKEWILLKKEIKVTERTNIIRSYSNNLKTNLFYRFGIIVVLLNFLKNKTS